MSQIKPKALIAMSGGVDSSAAAYFMQQAGYDCAGAIMKLYEHHDSAAVGKCGSADDMQDAHNIASRLGMPFHVLDFTAEFKREIIAKFCDEYMAGRTPNPCIDCNRLMKFGLFLQRARLMDCGVIATGHYARIEQSNTGRWLLRKAADSTKDQSYVLYTLKQEQLAQVKLPLGEMTKQQVRNLAAQLDFLNAEKPDSQDICFVPDGDYGSFLEHRLLLSDYAGDFVDAFGTVLGRHRGHYRYTVGQRKGLGLAFDSPRYVIAKDSTANTVTLGKCEELLRGICNLADINLIAVDKIEQSLQVKIRTRYHQKEVPCTVTQTGQDTLRIEFSEPQAAIAPGQAAVIYDGDYVVGGGTIQ